MSRPLKDGIEYTKTGRIKNLEDHIVFDNIKKLMYQVKDIRVIKTNEGLFVKDSKFKLEENPDYKFNKSESIDNFIILEPEDAVNIIKATENDIDSERHVVYLDDLEIDDNTHIYNRYLINYIKSIYNNKIFTKEKGKVNGLLNTLKKSLDKPYSHKRTESLFEKIGVSYDGFIKYIKENK